MHVILLPAPGGRPDGDPKINPHYRYGGLWKNHHAQVSGKNKVPKPKDAARTAAGKGVTPASASAADEDEGRSSSSDQDQEDKALLEAISKAQK